MKTLSIRNRDRIIRKVRRDYKAWTNPVHIVMGVSVGKKDGYKLPRAALMDSILDDSLGDLDALLTQAVDGNPETDAALCRLASILLYKLAETEPPPLKWFPKELAMLASVKLLELADKPPARHQGTNSADYASRDHFIVKKVAEVCQDYGINPTRNDETGYRDSGCSLVAEALHFEEKLVKEVWRKGKQF